MKRGFEKIAAAVLTAALVFTLLSAVAWADDLPSGVTWSGSESDISYSDGTITITGDGTLTVSSDVTISGGITVSSGTVSIVVNSGATLTSTSGHTIKVGSDANVTISGSGTIKTSGGGIAAVYNSYDGTCRITGGTYTSNYNNCWYVIANYGTMTIDGDNVVVTNKDVATQSSLIINVTSDTTTTEKIAYLTINSGTFTSNGYNVVKNDDGGNLTINGGNFTAAYPGDDQYAGAVIQNWNVATINGGTFTATNVTYVISTGTYYISSNDIGTSIDVGQLTITGGTFIVSENTKGYLFGTGVSNSDCSEASVTVYGGTFEGEITGADDDSAIEYTLTIYHGDFTDNSAANYVATDVTSVTIDGKTVSVDAVITVSESDGTTAVHALAKVEAVAATCTTNGNIEYYYCVYTECSGYFVATTSTDEDGNTTTTYTQVNSVDVVIDAGHDWDYDNPSITWSDDYSEITIVYTCSVCGETFTVTDYVITSVENEDGSITYTATYTGPDGGNYETDITVTGSSTAAATGDSGIALWIVLIALAGCGALGLGLKRRFE